MVTKRRTKDRKLPLQKGYFEKVLVVKGVCEEDSKRRITWSEFFAMLATGYCIGMAVNHKDQWNLRIEDRR